MTSRQYIVAGYTQDGELAGFVTFRETLSGWSKKAARFDDKHGATRLANKLERWKTYIWVVELEPKTDVCIPPEPLPLRPKPALDTINSQPLE